LSRSSGTVSRVPAAAAHAPTRVLMNGAAAAQLAGQDLPVEAGADQLRHR